MNIDLAREHVVILNGGSGCIIQPMTDEYLYVLTAKHNIVDNNNQLSTFVRFKFENNVWNDIEIELNDFLEGQHYFFHPNKDVAIIKIPPLQGFNDALRHDNIIEEKSDYYILGYPEIRRNNNLNNREWYRIDSNIQILDVRGDGMYEAQIPGNATLNEIRGDSGGPILKVIHDKLYIAGIQNKMAEEDEQLGRVRFSTLSSFDEIVNLNPLHLEPILPSYFKSFAFLQDDAFNLTYGLATQERSEKLTLILKAKAIELSRSNLVPFAIKKFLEENLPVFHGQECYDNYQKKLWILWLELLTALNVARDYSHVIDDLPDILKKVRFFYSNTDKDFWVAHLRDLHKRDYSGLDEDAVVVVASNMKAEDGFHVLNLSKIPGSITLIKDSKQAFELGRIGMKTTIATEFPLEKYRFMNISAFKEGTVNEMDDSFARNDIPTCIHTLKELYGQLIPNW